MAKFNPPDYILIFTVAVLLIVGTLMLFSVSAPLSQVRFGNPYYFFNHHILFGLIPGLILAFIAFKIPLAFLKKWAPILLLINFILMVMVFVPEIGLEFGGATRWIDLGKVTLQPSEFLKITFILYLAAWLSSRSENLKSNPVRKHHNSHPMPLEKRRSLSNATIQTFFAFLILISLITLLLVFQPDISTLAIIVLTGIIIYFLAGAPMWQMISIILIGAISLFSLIKIAAYRMERLLVFLKPETDFLGIGYHLNQALIALGSGGIFGLGLGMSQQKFGFLPHTLTDSIFAIFSEETGFIGSSVLLLLFLIFFWRGFTIGSRSQDKFSQLLAFGITFWIVMQAFFNIGAMTGLLPLTGIPLPFISYGGSALVATMTGVGILLNISKNLR